MVGNDWRSNEAPIVHTIVKPSDTLHGNPTGIPENVQLIKVKSFSEL